MAPITVYGIRHKPSGEFMPARMSRCGFGGWTWWRESESSSPYDPTPRLFPSKQGAQNALTAWLRGRWVTIEERSGGFEDESFDRYPVPEASKIPRVRAEMEIVVFDLTERVSS